MLAQNNRILTQNLAKPFNNNHNEYSEYYESSENNKKIILRYIV